jgi:hypothetical protein
VCEEQLCFNDDTLAQQCTTFLELCLAQGGEEDEDECVLGGLFICEGGACGQDLCVGDEVLAQECSTFLEECLTAAETQPDVEECVGAAILKCAGDPLPAEGCQSDLCVDDDVLAQQCTTFFEACLAQATEEDEDECALGAAFICEGGACGREACANDEDLAQACQTFLDDCLAAAETRPNVEACVAAALFQCDPACVDEDCNDGVFCNGEEKCNVQGECDESPGDPCGLDETCNEEADTCDGAELCIIDLDCDDGIFCNGEEKCGLGGECDSGPGDPCGPRETCNEDLGMCVEEP